MRRRAYLSLVTVVLAGCGSQGTNEEGTPTAAATTTATETETPTPTATAEPTATAVEAPSDPLDAYEFWLTNAFETYVPEGETFTSVDSSMTSLDVATTREHLQNAKDLQSELDAAGLSGESETRYNRLTGVYNFLRRTVTIHEHLTTAWAAHQDAWDAVVTQEGSPSEAYTTVQDSAKAARAELNTMEGEVDRSHMGAFTPLLNGDYDDKTSLLDEEISSYLDLVKRLQDLNSAMSDADTGIVHWNNESWTPASVAFKDAANAFQTVAGHFSSGWPDHFHTTTDDAQCVASAMQSGCSRLSNLAQALAEGSEDDAAAAKANARGRFEECALVFDRVSIIKDFYA